MPPATHGRMTNRSLDERVTIIEASMGGKTLAEHFREHAELIDRRFAEVHARLAAQDRRFDAIDARFVAFDSRFAAIDAQFMAVHAQFGAMDERFNRVDHELGLVRREVAGVHDAVNRILRKLSAT